MTTTYFADEFQNARNIFITSTYLQRTRKKQEQFQAKLDLENLGLHQDWKWKRGHVRKNHNGMCLILYWLQVLIFYFIDSGTINRNSWPTDKENHIWRKITSFLFIVAYPQPI